MKVRFLGLCGKGRGVRNGPLEGDHDFMFFILVFSYKKMFFFFLVFLPNILIAGVSIRV